MGRINHWNSILPLVFSLLFYQKKIHLYVIKTLFVLIVISQFALVKYSLTTLINLGADILGYSTDDMYTTVTYRFCKIILHLFSSFYCISPTFLGINFLLNRNITEKKIYLVSGAILVVLGGMKMVIPGTNQIPFIKTKLHFFVSDMFAI